jgi:DNA-directed RNA polymerase specialized sigma24 family protein
VSSHDELLLRRFVACRDTGDAAGAQRWWRELVELNFDRVRSMVDVWGRGGRLSADERDEATQLALVKLWRNMVHSFHGGTMGEWVNATRSLVDYACLDVQRKHARRSGREASLDEQRAGDEGDVSSVFDKQLGDLARERQRRGDERSEARDFVDWALPRIKNERRRVVLERTLDGAPADVIAAELDVEMANLYQLRRRGLDDLGELRREWEQ